MICVLQSFFEIIGEGHTEILQLLCQSLRDFVQLWVQGPDHGDSLPGRVRSWAAWDRKS